MRSSKSKQEGSALLSVLIGLGLLGALNVGLSVMTSRTQANSQKAKKDVLRMDTGLYLYHNIHCGETIDGATCGAIFKDVEGKKEDGSVLIDQEGTTKLGPFFVKLTCQGSDFYLHARENANGPWDPLNEGVPKRCAALAVPDWPDNWPPAPPPDPNNFRIYLTTTGTWGNLICGSNDELLVSETQSHQWERRNDRTFYNLTVNKYLDCPERGSGTNPTLCECKSGSGEAFHFRDQAQERDSALNAVHTQQHYPGDNVMATMASNNSFNACLKVLGGNEVHLPCNPYNYHLDPRYNAQKCNDNDSDFNEFTHAEHQESCSVVVVPSATN